MKKTLINEEKYGVLFFVKYPKQGLVKSRLSYKIEEKLVLKLWKHKILFINDLTFMLLDT